MIIIAILAMLTIPRLVGTQAREAEVEARAVKALLSQAAQQDAVTSGALALNFDHEKQELSVQALVEDKDGKRDWGQAPMIRPVHFALIEIVDATADGQPQLTDTSTGGGFRLLFAGARPRPAVSLLLRTVSDMPGAPHAWQVDLLPNQTVAAFRAIGADAPLLPAEGTAIDLDQAGQRNQSW